MDDQSQALTYCASCGTTSSDSEWCEHCGAQLSPANEVEAQPWLRVGERVLFELDDKALAGLQDEFDEELWEGPKTRLDVPIYRPESANDAKSTQPVKPVELEQLAAAAGDEALELIGPKVKAPITPIATDAIPDLSDEVVAEMEFEVDDSPGGLEVEITNQREAYSQRRLWDALDEVNDQAYVIEERKLLANESLEEALEFAASDAFSNRFIYNPIARCAKGEHVLTLYEAPRGQSVEAWRRAVGREAATPRAILGVLRPLAQALQEIHENGRVHLHINPRTIWINKGQVGFTGIDQLEKVPLNRTRFRATIGFSAPEVFGRTKQPIDFAADIYSLGAVAYYLVAGVIPPVAPETAFAPALAPRDFRPSFPIGWSEAILRATDPVAVRRFQTPLDFLESIESGYRQMKARNSQEQPITLLLESERHIGYNKKKRSPINQDHVFTALTKDRRRGILMVGDGVSTATYGSGDLASGFLAKRTQEAWAQVKQAKDFSPEEVVQEIIDQANRDIIEYVNQEYGQLQAGPSHVMGSTALVGIIEDGVFTLGSVGDSRCYIIRSEMMECLTRDHNLFTLSLVEGHGIEEVISIPHGDALARCLGTFEVREDGLLEAIDVQADIFKMRLIPGDNVLLCSDGLFDYAGSTYEESEANIRQRVLSESHPGLSALELIILANRGGGGDNIGIAMLKVLNEIKRDAV